MKKSSLRAVALIWAAVMIAVLSSTATLMLSGRAGAGQSEDTLRVSRAQYDTIERYARLEQVRDSLMQEYYQDLDEDALILGAIRGMADSIGDPYTFYYTPEEMQRTNENNSGNYRGIGVLLQNTDEGMIRVIRVYSDSPAEAGGLREGDLIVGVDGEEVSGADGHSYSDAVNRMRGEDGTQVTLTVLRGEEQLDLTLTRGEVVIDYARWQMLDGNIGYIGITQFTGNAAEIFGEAIDAFTQREIRGLVIDLRNNPGGFLDQVVSIADRLLPKGLIVYVKEKDGTRQDYYSDEECLDVPIAVLVNENSASASEILALAIQAFERGVVVGTNTYGKGIVQSLKVYPEDGAGLQLTTSSYYDMLDRCPQGVGVTPDVQVEMDAQSIPAQPDPQADPQLEAALARLQP